MPGTYISPAECELYYLQSRYYDPVVARFINADELVVGLIGSQTLNLYTYCANVPVAFKDNTGYAIDTVLDVASLAYSFLGFIFCPTWENVGYLVWDLVSALLPFVPGSYVAKAGKITISIASKIDDLADGSKLLTGSYNLLKKVFKWVDGIEIHHLVEKRFKKLFSCSPGEFLSIPLTSDLHQIITNRWRNLHKEDDIFKLFAYGSNYRKITYEMMEMAIKKVYGDMPGLLQEVLQWFRANWRY